MANGIMTLQELEELVNGLSNFNYQTIDVSLASTFTDQQFDSFGTYFAVVSITPGASVDICFNDARGKKITLNSNQRFTIPFTKFFLSNSTAVAGATIQIYAGLNTSYMPPYGVDSISAYVSSQAVVTTAVAGVATLIAAANNARRQMVVFHDSATDSIYIGGAAVTTANGLAIPVGGERDFTSAPFFNGALYAITAGTTINVSVWYMY